MSDKYKPESIRELCIKWIGGHKGIRGFVDMVTDYDRHVSAECERAHAAGRASALAEFHPEWEKAQARIAELEARNRALVFAANLKKEEDEFVASFSAPAAPSPAAVKEEKPAMGEEMPSEAEAFEAWAKSKTYDMTTHPVHWLFLDSKTYAARQGWKAGLEHGRACMAPRQPVALTDERIYEIASSYMEADTGMYVSFLPSNLDRFVRAILLASQEVTK
jgi:hypothetical protein